MKTPLNRLFPLCREKVAVRRIVSRRRGSRSIRSQAGLTLVEIIVVLVILALLISFLTGGLFSQGEKAKAQLNVLRMKKLQAAVNQFQLQYNTLPSSMAELTGCPANAGGACVPVADPEDAKDAWGTDFEYKSDGRSYEIKSLGADRSEGGTGVDSDARLKGP